MYLEIDLSNAFDSVRWDFIKFALAAVHLPPKVINWILQCGTEPFFSFLVNGVSYGFFKGNRGRHQGCPLSPHTFCTIMEFFSAKLQQCVQEGLISTPHKKGNCEIAHLFFANDVMIFFNASIPLANNIRSVLQDLFSATGL